VQIAIKMLGELQVFHNNLLTPLPSSKLTRALLVYLLLNNRPQRRDYLCTLFWPEAKDARGSLRWSLSKLRAILNNNASESGAEQNIERVVADKDYVSINKTDIDIDLVNLCSRAAQQQHYAGELTELAKQLAMPLLDGLDLHNHPDFQHWLIAQRQQLIQLRSKLLSQIAASAKCSVTDAAKTAPLPARPRQALQLQYQADIRYCAGDDGVKIAYVSTGWGLPLLKPPALLNHLQYDWHAPLWGRIFHQLAGDYQLIRYDDRGSGMSERNIDGVSVDDLAQDLATVVTANNLSQFALLGISNSVALCIDYAARHPEQVSHLILFNGYAAGWCADGDPQLREKMQAIIALAETGWEQDNTAFRQFFSMTFVPDASQHELDWFNEYLLLAANAKNAAALMSAFADWDVRSKLTRIKVPTLVIHSLGDKAVPALSGREIAATIPGAEFIGLDSTSHLLLEHEPSAQQFIDIIHDFISRHQKSVV
jgi:pimeloyl-ACP methyl ester carboxylesterase